MSAVRNELKSIAIEVNDILSRYIEIHDDVFKFSWRKIIPLPFVFKSIDFNDVHTQVKQILSELETCNEQINGLIENIAQKESRFAHFLSEYCIALIETVSLLKEILYQLYLKSQNSNEYSLSEYNKHCDLYKKAVDKYSSMGNRLNELYAESNRFESKSSEQTTAGIEPRKDLSEEERKKIEERLEKYSQEHGIKSSFVIEELLDKNNERDEMLSKISNQPKIIEVLQRYGKASGEIKDIFWKLMASGAGEHVAQSVIESPKLLSQYLQMKDDGVSDMEIAFKFTKTSGGS